MSNVANLCDRMSKAEEAIDEHHKKLAEFHEALAENTKMTKEGVTLAQKSITINQAPADNTAELVELFKGAKAFRKFILWAVGLGAPLWGIIEAIRHFK
jgi:hypothetical protein